MRKMVISMVVAAMLMGTVASAAPAGRGGLMGFIGGCCFGLRTGAAYNDGKELHWRDWIRLIPIIPAIWDGIECAEGKTTADYAQQYGTMYY